MKRSGTVCSLTKRQRQQLVRVAKSRTAPHRLVQRATMILGVAEGCTQVEAARRAGLSRSMIGRWVERFKEEGVEGLSDRPRSGRPPTYDELSKGRVIQAAKTDPRTLGMVFGHWTLDRLVEYAAEHVGISVKRVQIYRWLKREGLRWRKEQTWFSERCDPQFAEKRGPSLTFISGEGRRRPGYCV